MEGGALARAHCFSRDVTGAKEVEADRRSGEDRYHRLVEGVREYAVHTLDPEGRVSTWNRGAEGLYGWAQEEVLGRDFSLFFAPEDLAAGMSERILRLVCNDGRFHHAGWRARKDGSRFWAEVTLTALRDAGGRVEEIAHVTRDASERRRLDALRRKAADLSAANLAIMDAQRKTARLLDRVGTLMEAPMAAIERAAARLRDPGAAASAALDAAAVVEDGVASLRRELVRSQDLARSDVGPEDARAGSVDLLRLAVEARDVLKEAALAREVRVEIEVDPGLTSVRADEGHLELLLHNLLANAIHLSRVGSCVSLRVLPEGPRSFRIEAEDMGLGLAPDEIARRMRGDEPSGAGGPSAGPWIAPARELVEQRGGRLVVQSVSGRGSVFSAILPMLPAAGGPAAGNGGTLAAARGARVGHVLVVADSPAAQASLRWGFGSMGWEVISVLSVEEAYDVLRSHTFDLVAVDVALSQVGAVDFVTRLRQEGLSRSVPHVLAVIHLGAVGEAGLLVADLQPQPARADHQFAALERAGVPRGNDASILVLNGDGVAVEATARTLSLLGYRPVHETDAERALRQCAMRPPSAVFLCPVPVGPDAFEFVHHLRRIPELRHTPLFLQAPRTLDPAQFESLRKAAAEAVQSGVGQIHQVLEDGGLPRSATGA